MEKISYNLEKFQGPLDLLINLITKHKLDIMDIQISVLLAQYMLYMEQVQQLNMEISSEFLEMASRLVYIKTAQLLPKHEDAEKLKQELTGELIEYQELKKVASAMQQKINLDFICRQPLKLAKDFEYKIKHTPSELFKFYKTAVGKKDFKKPVLKENFSNIIERKIISVLSRVLYVLKFLRKNSVAEYKSFFKKASSRSELVSTFLAILELIKNKKVNLEERGENLLLYINKNYTKTK